MEIAKEKRTHQLNKIQIKFYILTIFFFNYGYLRQIKTIFQGKYLSSLTSTVVLIVGLQTKVWLIAFGEGKLFALI